MSPDSTTVRTDPDWFAPGLASCPVMAVFRGLSPDETVTLANHAWDLGVTQVEVPIESKDSLPSLAATISAGADRGVRVGAGTIISAEHLKSAVDAGAAYVVSPGLDPNLIALADRMGVPVLPGVATASEILRARNMGFQWLKAFPASVLGAGWFSAMRGPFSTLQLVGTGGLNARNAKEFLDAGVSVVGVGGAFANAQERELLSEIIESTKK